jgi:uroporphyrinogen decarboxylase
MQTSYTFNHTFANASIPRACRDRRVTASAQHLPGSPSDPLLLRVARGEGALISLIIVLYHLQHTYLDCTLDVANNNVCLFMAICHVLPQPSYNLLFVLIFVADAERTPVWLMRQAGRYMAEFRKYSDRIPFRERSETSEIAIELSLQPWRAFRPDGVIMFSDILTPLPALGVEFDVIKGKGPVIETPIRSMEQVRALQSMDAPANKLPFVAETLSALRSEVGSAATVLGFIGTPWTLAAYSIEGKAERNCRQTKTMMLKSPEILHAFLAHLAEALAEYAVYQIDSGAHVVQLFDSWAHHLSPEQFAEFSLPYAEQVMASVRARRPHVPLILHCNGGTGKHHVMARSSADVLGLDWACTMAAARGEFGGDRVLQGNVDPMILFGNEGEIRDAVERCLVEGGPRRHILNVGHGVIEGTPEENVGLFCDLARKSAEVHEKQLAAA